VSAPRPGSRLVVDVLAYTLARMLLVVILTAAIFEEFELKPDLQPITSADWKAMRPTTATRPAYSVLDVEPFTRLIGRPMRPWRDALRTIAAEVKARGGFA